MFFKMILPAVERDLGFLDSPRAGAAERDLRNSKRSATSLDVHKSL